MPAPAGQPPRSSAERSRALAREPGGLSSATEVLPLPPFLWLNNERDVALKNLFRCGFSKGRAQSCVAESSYFLVPFSLVPYFLLVT